MDEYEDDSSGEEVPVVDLDPIELHLCRGNILVWNANGKVDDVQLLRETHHIVGALVGSLPRSPRQNAQLGLPLQLMPEEAAVLIDYDVAKLVNVKTTERTAGDVVAFEQARQRSFQEQQALWDALSLKKKQDFEQIIAMGRTTKKHRRAERSKRNRGGKGTPVASIRGGSSESRSPDEAGGSRRGDEVAVATGWQDNRKRLADNAGGDPSPLTSLAASEPSMSASQESAADNSKDSACDTPGFTEASHVTCGTTCDTNGKTERTGSRTRPIQGDPTQAICEAGATIKSSITVDSAGEESKAISGTDRIPTVEPNHEVEPKHDSHGSPSCPSSGDGISSHQANEKLGLDSEVLHVSANDGACPENINNARAAGEISTRLQNQSMQSGIGDPRASPSDDSEAMVVDRADDRCSPTAESIKHNEVDTFKKPLSPQKYSGCLVHLVTASPATLRQEVMDWAYPGTPQELLKYRVFKDLWETGYFLTSGCKFGGDFLVYPGDPFLYHSYFIAVCVPFHKPVSPLQLITFGRLGTNVKKTVVLCSVDDGDEVVYTSLQWTGIS